MKKAVFIIIGIALIISGRLIYNTMLEKKGSIYGEIKLVLLLTVFIIIIPSLITSIITRRTKRDQTAVSKD